MQSKPFSTNKTLNIGGRLIDLRDPKIMGILNVTPDSFYDGGRFLSEDAMLRQTEKMLSEGADFIDVGGYSSRPGAQVITPEEEVRRTVAAISAIVRRFPTAIVSVDTFRAAVAAAAVEAGAAMINDIAGGDLDDEMFDTVARLNVPYIVMHMRGDPQTMAHQAQYTDLMKEITDYFHRKLRILRDLGVKDVIIDPGFGFAKNVAQNFTLLRHLDRLSMLERPVLTGLSRKSMIWRTLGVKPDQALNGTTALHMLALLKGTDILRVHDAKEAREVVQLVTRLREA